uniref:Uncharacterized protein n=1 Tax=Arundo donax TaxID=35708 RepID=A0A0A9EHZ2_ARUDO
MNVGVCAITLCAVMYITRYFKVHFFQFSYCLIHFNLFPCEYQCVVSKNIESDI